MKKVLILSPFFYPEPISTGKYNTYLAKSFSEHGHDVDVCCSHPVYPKWVVEKAELQMEGVNAIRGGGWLRYPSGQLLRRLVLELWFFMYVGKVLFCKRKKYDLIVPVFPPSLFMLLLPLLRPKSSKVVGIVHDLQGVYAQNQGGLARKLVFSAINWVERRSFRTCDYLVFLSDAMRRVAIDTYGLGVDDSSVQYPFVTISPDVEANKLESIIPDGQLSIVYSGALGEKQAPDKLVLLMSEIIDAHQGAKAYVFSQGPIFERLKKEYASEYFEFLPLVDEEQLPELLARSSVQIIPQETGTSDGSLPSKLPNLLASGTKVLCITDAGSELVDIMERYSNGVAVQTWEMDVVVEKAVTLISSSHDHGNDELLQQFTLDGLIAKINSVI